MLPADAAGIPWPVVLLHWMDASEFSGELDTVQFRSSLAPEGMCFMWKKNHVTRIDLLVTLQTFL